MICPLCNDKKIIRLESINSKALSTLYTKLTGLNLNYLLDRDIEYCECQSCKLRFFNPLITGDEKFYNSLQKLDWYYMDDKDEFFQALKYINSDDRVLEVGSGKGAFAQYLPTQHYVGLDFSKKAKEMAFQDGVVIRNEAIQDYAANNPESVDVVVSFQVLEHVADPKSFIEAQLYALVPGGKMIIAVPSEDSFLQYACNSILNMPPHHVTRWTDETLNSIAELYNLKVLNIHHENLQEIHKQWFLQTLICTSACKVSLLNSSLIYKVISKISNVFSTIIVKGLKSVMLPRGHTVLVVYEKL